MHNYGSPINLAFVSYSPLAAILSHNDHHDQCSSWSNKQVAIIHNYFISVHLDTDKQLYLRDEVIYQLKQEISLLKEKYNSAVFMFKERIAILTEQLRNQQIVKKETGESHIFVNFLFVLIAK